jgi:hypothetical protein
MGADGIIHQRADLPLPRPAGRRKTSSAYFLINHSKLFLIRWDAWVERKSEIACERGGAARLRYKVLAARNGKHKSAIRDILLKRENSLKG